MKKKEIEFSNFLKNYNNCLTNKYVSPKLKVQELKEIAKLFCLKTTTTKPVLIEKINEVLTKHYAAVEIQKFVRRLQVTIWIKLHGPCFNNVSKCNNLTDFLTMESLTKLKKIKIFTFKDEQGFVYGFDISSFHQLFKSSTRSNPLKNPYNKDLITRAVITQHLRLIQLSKILKINVLDEESDQPNNLIFNETPEDRALRRTKEIFIEIDTLGNYSDYIWFFELNHGQLRIFLRELYDIWNYRANLSIQQKMEICPHDNLFSNINGRIFNITEDLATFQNSILDILYKLVTSGINTSSKTLGSYYVLGALTIVSPSAANSLPWLYESFRL